MKVLLSAGLSLLLLTGACKKSSRDGSLYGNWKLKWYSAGLAGGFQPGPDSVYILSLQGDHQFTSKINADVKGIGAYTVTDIKVGDDHTPAIAFGNLPGPGGPCNCGSLPPGVISAGMTLSYQLNKDTLILGTSIADGPAFQYERVN
ncbi:MAG: hypothetical protein ABUM51_06010 [Bacteroidota bacterium]